MVAPGGFMKPETPERLDAALGAAFGAEAPEVVFHPQCFEVCGHFAGDDARRLSVFVEVANDPAVDAVWFGKGGYGANRIAERAVAALGPVARAKPYLGYSDAGFLLAALDRAGFEAVAHGPMAQDVLREGGGAAVERAVNWLTRRDPAALEPSAAREGPALAFNLTILSALLGTPLEPDFADRVLMVEEVGEHMYRIDRLLFHVTSNPSVRRARGLRLGRLDPVPENDPDFVRGGEDVAREWCERSGLAWLGRADIGHDADNKVVPFR